MDLEVHGRYAKIEGMNVYYETVGEGHPVILLHLAGFDGRVYRPLYNYLPEKKYKLIVPDLPGHGKSDPWPDWQRRRVSLHFFADVITKLVDSLGLSQLSFVGTSMGGNMSLLLGARLGRRVKGVVSCNGAGRTRTFTERDIEMADNQDVGRTLRFAGELATKRTVEYLTWVRSGNRREILVNDLQAWNEFDIMDELKKIETKVLLARGEYEPLVTENMLRETASQIKDVRIVTIRGVGHYAPAENPEEFSKVVFSFLDEVTKP